MTHYIIFGPPGAGKGTQAELMVKKYNLLHISTGELLRAEIKKGTELGIMAKALIDAGNLVPDEVVVAMIKHKFTSNPDVSGFILDGFPRTTAQAATLDELLGEMGKKVDKVISIIVSDATVRDRIRHRAQIEDRKDDIDDEVIATRIRNYHQKTEPLIDFYKAQNKYFEINGEGSVEKIFEEVCTLIDNN